MSTDNLSDGNGHRSPLQTALSSDDLSFREEDVAQKAEKALRERPSFSIRARMTLAFLAIFALCMGLVFWAMWSISSIEDKLAFLEILEDYTSEIQQARRFEKNYLLYGTNLDDAVSHALVAHNKLWQYSFKVKKVIGDAGYEETLSHLTKYRQLLSQLGKTGPAQAAGKPQSMPSRAAIESELREHGNQMVSVALTLVERERADVAKRFQSARQRAFIFLGILLVVMIYLAHFLARQVVGTLTRFLKYTERIGEGDFSPIMPVRPYRDEFSRLAIAFNQMTRELNRRHKILVESHKLRAVGTLVAGVAHELNNPLNNITLTAAMLMEDYQTMDDEERLELVADLTSQADRAHQIVKNLLNFARQSETTIEPLDIEQILEDTARLVGNQIKLHKIKLTITAKPGLPPVHGDRQMLTQVFMNLLLNAIDVLPKRGEIDMTADHATKDGFLAVDVSDNGPGIPEHVLGSVFDPFFTTKPTGQGTGLGLSVSRGIVRQLGGYIRVSSTVGVGTTFTVLLPITTVPADMGQLLDTVEMASIFRRDS